MAPMKNTNTLAPSATVTSRDPKGRKFMDIIAAAYDKAGLSKVEAQRVNDTAGLSDLVTGFIAENRVREEFKNEEVKSNCGYLSGYKKPADLNAQCNQLRILFPGIGYANQDLLARIEKGEVKLPRNAEGWFAIPNWKKNPKIFGSTYSQAVQTVLDANKKARDGAFYNYRDGQVDEEHLRQSVRSEKFWNELAKSQGDADILIIAAQFGIRHRGRSVRRARVVMEDTPGEVGLGAFVIGIMILTHPIRLQHYNDLWIDCAGDEWSPDAAGDFSDAPFFNFRGGRLGFVTVSVDLADDRYGAASGFSPQYPDPSTSNP